MTVASRSETIGQRVKRIRKEKGLSQIALSEGICSSSTVSLLETDQHIPAVDIMQKIAEKLSVPLADLVQGKETVLDMNLQIDLIETYVETRDYANALPLIQEIEEHEGLAEYQARRVKLALAECLSRTGKARCAVDLLNDLLQKTDTQREQDMRFLANLHNKLGTAHYLSQNMTYAHANYLRAHQVASAFPEYDMLSAIISYNLADTLRLLGMYADAVIHLKQAHDFFSQSTDMTRLAHSLFNLGLTLSNLGHLNEASDHLRQALTIYQAQNMLNIAQKVKHAYAFDILSRQKPDLAINELIQCSKTFGSLGDTAGQAYTLAKVALLCIHRSELSKAESCLKDALSLFTEEEVCKDEKLPYIYYVYSMYLSAGSDDEQAILYASKSGHFYDKMGLYRESADAFQIAVDIYEKKGNFAEAFQVLNKVNKALRTAQDKSLLQTQEGTR